MRKEGELAERSCNASFLIAFGKKTPEAGSKPRASPIRVDRSVSATDVKIKSVRC